MDKNIIEIQKEKELLNAVMRTDFYSFYKKFFIEYTGEKFDDSEIIKYLFFKHTVNSLNFFKFTF